MSARLALLAALGLALACRAAPELPAGSERRAALAALADRRAGGTARFVAPAAGELAAAPAPLSPGLARAVESAALAGGGREALVDLALLELARGETGAAVDALRRAARHGPDPAVEDLLAAARLAHASAEDDPLELLAAAEALLGAGPSPLADVNRAGALARLELPPAPAGEPDALDRARVDAYRGLRSWLAAVTAGSAAEADAALATLAAAAEVLRREAADHESLAFLATLPAAAGERRAYADEILRYFSAYADFDALRIEAAEPALRAARLELARYRSPFVEWSDLYLAACRFHRRQFAGVAADAERIGRAAADARRRTLAGRAFWLQGLTLLQSGRPIEARAALEASSRHLSAVRSHALDAFVQGLYAECSAQLGDARGAWRGRLRALAALARAGAPAQLATLMLEDSRQASDAGFARVGLAWAEQAVALADGAPAKVGRVEARLRLAEAASAAGRGAEAERALADAMAARARVDSAQLRRNLDVRAALAASRVLERRAPLEAIARLTAALSTPEGAGPDLQELELLGRRATLRRVARDFAGARADLDRALELLGRQSAGPLDEETRIRARDRARDLWDERIALELDRGAEGSALLETLRRMRRSAAGGGRKDRELPTPEQIAARLDAGSALLVYWTLPGETVALALTRDGVAPPLRLPLSRSDLAARVLDLRAALVLDDRAHLEGAAAGLAERLVAPLRGVLQGRTRLYLTGDTEIESVPWELLPAAPGVPLGEGRALAFLPDLDLFAPEGATLGAERLLVVADPAFGAAAGAGLPRLARARREGEEVAARFPGATLLAAEAATEARLVAELGSRRYAWLHVAAHVLPGFAEPQSSKLLLAASGAGDDGELSAAEVGRLDLAGLDTVVLSACGSALGYPSATRGTLALSRAFLEAGAKQVVATLWEVDDEAARKMVALVYDELGDGSSPMQALALAKSRARSSNDVSLVQPRSWAAFVLLVAGVPGPTAVERGKR